MPIPRPTAPHSLRLYRVLLAVGGLVLVLVAAAYRIGGPADLDPLAGRLALGLVAVGLAGLTFVNSWVQKNAIALVYGLFYAVSAWQIGLAALNGLSPTAAFGLILAFVGCSAGFQTFRALTAYSVLFVAATAAVAVGLDDPLVPSGAFLATLAALAILGTYLFQMRHEYLLRLDTAREQALAAARAKSDFLATMSHEIRTPLNGVIGMTDVLAATPLSADQREALATIRASGDALLGVISDVLDFAKIEADHIDLEARPLALRDLVEDTLDVVARDAARRRVEVVGHVRPGVPARVVGDATRLRQIVLNLLSNAVKFTHAGEVVLRVDAGEPDASGAVALRIAVTDAGIGIAPDRLEALFDPFTQADASTTRRYGGTGLGLAISRRLAERMGGTLTATSTLGEGSTFTLALPLAVAASAALPPVVPGRPTVLVLDDSLTVTAALADALREAGFEPHIEHSLEGALAALDGGSRFALALVDHDLGGVSGLEAAERLRACEHARDLRIALLAPVGAAVRAAHRVDAVLARPVRTSRLRETLAALVGASAREARPGEAAAAAAPAPTLRVLLAEDQPVNQQVALGLLRQLGLEADVVETGRAAVEAATTFAYDVVLMDVQMPEMDGLDATRAIRAAEITQPAILALTANAIGGDAERCLEAGMDGYLAKPVRIGALREALERATGRALAVQPPPPPPVETPRPEPAETPAPMGPLPTPAHVVAHLRALTDGDDALADEILDAYLRTDLALVSDLTVAATTAEAAHKLKASSGTLGADALAARADALERDACAGQPSAAAARRLADDLHAFRAVVSDARGRLKKAALAPRP